jgi:pimeloyl-ACP methyl ester carboxylesterase
VKRDLHDLLNAAGERPPYVLVGASRGGMLIRLYLLDYPDQVTGLVFVDPSTEDRLFTMLNGEGVLIARHSARSSCARRFRPVRLRYRAGIHRLARHSIACQLSSIRRASSWIRG